MSDLPHDENEYRGAVMQGVLAAVVDAGAVEGSGGGMVNLEAAVEAMCDAIAALVNGAGTDPTAKDRRDTADYCRKRILMTSNALARAAEAGEPLGWKLESMATKN